MNILELQNVSYSYDGTAPVLNHQSYGFEKGKLNAVAGNPGAGKTTLLLLLAGIADPTEGVILYEGRDLRKIDRCQYRSRSVGTVFNGFNLLPQLTAAENVEQTIELAGIKDKDKHQCAAELLDQVGLSQSEAGQRVSKLSEGEKQRVAIARILSYHPDILLVDEPADGLDAETAQQMMATFVKLAHEENTCVILATQSTDAAAITDAAYELSPILPAQHGETGSSNSSTPETETASKNN